MKKVKFIDIKAKSIGWSLWRGNMYEFPEIKEKIAEMIKDGWTYCGYIPIKTSSVANMDMISLLFEKDE